MKLLITSSSNPNSLAAYYVRYIKESPDTIVHEALTFDIEEKFISRSAPVRIAGSIFPWILAKKSTSHLLERAAEKKPDIIVIFKGMHILPSALHFLRNKGIRIVNYNPDHPLRYDSTGSGNRFVRQALKYYHLIYTYSPLIVSEINALYPKTKVKVLPFGFLGTHFNNTDLHKIERQNRICFAGIGDKQRRSEVNSILNAGFSVDIFGSGYEQLLEKHEKKLRIYPATFGDKFHQILQSYDVQLNLFRNQNRNAHNMRTFEIPAVGGIQVAPYSDQCTTFFEPGREIFMYRDSADLMKTLENLLTLSDKENLEYRHAARSRCLSEGYSYAHRARQMVEDLKVL